MSTDVPQDSPPSRAPQKAKQIRAINAYLKGEPIADAYDAWASDYDADLKEQGYVAPYNVAQAAAEYWPDRSARVLDAGCGTGLVGVEMAKLGFTALDGVDLSEQMLAEARGRGVYGALSIADLNAVLPIPSEAYDLVVSAGTLETGLVKAGVLLELLRVVRTGGRLCLSIDKRILAGFDTSALPVKVVLERDSDQVLPRLPGDEQYPYQIMVWEKTKPAGAVRRILAKLFG